MALPRDLSKSSLQYWGTIMGAAAARLNTADLWQAIDYYEVQNGIDDRNITLQDVNTLRSMAVAARNSSEALARGAGTAMDDRYIALAPWAGGLDRRNATQVYQVGFQHETHHPSTGETSIDYRTVYFRGGLPGSVDELMAAVEHDAEQLAAGYDREHVGISNVTILAV